MIPDHLKYTSQHEWALITETGTVRFGITDHAQDALGDIVFVTLPEPGSTLTAGETCGRSSPRRAWRRSTHPSVVKLSRATMLLRHRLSRLTLIPTVAAGWPRLHQPIPEHLTHC